jgi:hypothetical protein
VAEGGQPKIVNFKRQCFSPEPPPAKRLVAWVCHFGMALQSLLNNTHSLSLSERLSGGQNVRCDSVTRRISASAPSMAMGRDFAYRGWIGVLALASTRMVPKNPLVTVLAAVWWNANAAI